ncbi:MAG: leucyl/phenylalanyl-tRNA--protein transferase [Verrucomicrobiae bacterium]|nr:leucyl/phenylalanyl-tRNA--protein transferase [Verrucomicrobiae bacterium]
MATAPATLDHRLWFPDPRTALRDGHLDGLGAVGGDLRSERLALAYRCGFFPWTVRPITWWSPDPRAVFELGQLHRSRSLERTLRRQPFRLTRNRAFRSVIEACASIPRPGRWIVPEFIEAYSLLHQHGHAHSVECWLDDHLVGGIYGVAVGGLFAGESMFHRASDASKVAVVALHDHLVEQGFALFDIQMITPATAALGAREISRDEYLRRLSRAVALPCRFETTPVHESSGGTISASP